MPTSSPAGAAAVRPGTAAVLSFVAAGKLTSFVWLADGAAGAPDLSGRELLARAAAEQVDQYDAVAAVLAAVGPRPALVERFLTLLEEVGARTEPGDGWERLMRSVVIGGMVRDLDAALIGWLAREQRGLVTQTPRGPSDLIGDLLAPALAADERLRARLALWGRRTAGEALGILAPVIGTLHAQSVADGGDQDGSAAALAALQEPAMTAMSGGHARRMDRLGLTA